MPAQYFLVSWGLGHRKGTFSSDPVQSESVSEVNSVINNRNSFSILGEATKCYTDNLGGLECDLKNPEHLFKRRFFILAEDSHLLVQMQDYP